MLRDSFNEKDLGLFLDLLTYSIVCENNAGQYYPMYAYNHPLFTKDMHIYSDTKISDFLGNMTRDDSVDFLNKWNENCNHRDKVYISYDSTNKNCESGEIEMAEFGNAKVDVGSPIFNYAIGYDVKEAKPLFYESYLGSITDISQLEYTLNKIKAFGIEASYVKHRADRISERLQIADGIRR